MARSARFQGGDHHGFHAADVIRENTVKGWSFLALSFAGRRPTLGTRPRPGGACTVLKDPDIHVFERCCPTLDLSSINITLQILASTTSVGTLADGEKSFMQGDPSVRDELCHSPSRKAVRCVRGSTDPTGPQGLWAGEWHVGMAITNCSQLKKKRYEMIVHERCLFSKFAVCEEPAVDGAIAQGFVGCVLFEVDDYLMGGKAHHESMEKLRQKIKFAKWHRLLQDGPSFFGGRHVTQLPDRSFKVDMTRFIRERLRPISLQRGKCLDRSAEASDGEVRALRAVAGSLSWIARQCRPDEAGTASTLQGSVSRAVMKDLSDQSL